VNLRVLSDEGSGTDSYVIAAIDDSVRPLSDAIVPAER
jgi:hypothetical protein